MNMRILVVGVMGAATAMHASGADEPLSSEDVRSINAEMLAEAESRSPLLSGADAAEYVEPLPGSGTPNRQIMAKLRGSFAGGEGRYKVWWNAATIDVQWLGNATYIEIEQLFERRQYIAQLFARNGEPCIRLYELNDKLELGEAIWGLWAAPQSFVPISIHQLRPIADIPMMARSRIGDPEKVDYAGKSLYPTLVNERGTIEYTLELRLLPDAVAIVQREFDEYGKLRRREGTTKPWPSPERAHGWDTSSRQSPEDEGEIVFLKKTDPPATATTSPGGVTIIQLQNPQENAATHEPGDEVTVDYTIWLTDGTVVDSSSSPGGQALKAVIPGRLIQGWNEGLAGIAVGERRKLVIPPSLGYGDRGAARGIVPANATLIVDVTCTDVRKAANGEEKDEIGEQMEQAAPKE